MFPPCRYVHPKRVGHLARSNGVVAATRPGFILSATDVSVPYDGDVTLSITPDTVPTTDATVRDTDPQ